METTQRTREDKCDGCGYHAFSGVLLPVRGRDLCDSCYDRWYEMAQDVAEALDSAEEGR